MDQVKFGRGIAIEPPVALVLFGIKLFERHGSKV